MFNFSTVKSPLEINVKFILGQITDAMIFRLYFGPFKLGDIYLSKLRKDDTRPSAGFYLSKSDKLTYHDFGNGDRLDCFAYAQKWFEKISGNSFTFAETVNQIAKDFGLTENKTNPLSQKILQELEQIDKDVKGQTKIHFVSEKWTNKNLQFWNEYKINPDELRLEQYYAIKKLYINGKFIPNPTNEPKYALTVPNPNKKEGGRLTKVYAPYAADPKLKWINNIPLDIPFGMETLDYDSPFIFGVKGGKDLIVIKKFLPSVLGTQNENPFSFSKKLLRRIDFFFSEKYLGWDNDKTGLEGMEKMRVHGYKPVIVPVDLNKQGITDWSDLDRELGLDMVKYTLQMNKLL